MTNETNDTALEQAVLAAAEEVDGKRGLPCSAALTLAEQFGVAPTAVGRICNQNQIRVRQCQLGCFK